MSGFVYENGEPVAAQRGDTPTHILVSGIWLRRIGDDVQVLAEVDGEWRRCIVEHHDGSYSHIVEPSGILGAPLDEVTP